MLAQRKQLHALSPLYCQPDDEKTDSGFYYWGVVARKKYYQMLTDRVSGKAGELVAGLTEVGADVVALPVIAIADPAEVGVLDEFAGRAGDYDWIVFSSANAVDRFVGLLRDGRALGPRRVRAGGDELGRTRRWTTRSGPVELFHVVGLHRGAFGGVTPW